MGTDTARRQLIEKLGLAGLNEDYFRRLEREYWIDFMVAYQETGRCSSVNASSVHFIPVMSKLLDAIPSPAPRVPLIGLVVNGTLGYYSMEQAVPIWDSGYDRVELSGHVLEENMRARAIKKEEKQELQDRADDYSGKK